MEKRREVPSGAWAEARRLFEAGTPCAQAARAVGVGVSAAYSRARREGWSRPEKAAGGTGSAEAPERPDREKKDESVQALEECQRAVTRALFKAAQGLMEADGSEIARKMEPVDRALKLKRELARESREQGSTTVVVETLMPAPGAEEERGVE
jgi:transposase-like protein